MTITKIYRNEITFDNLYMIKVSKELRDKYSLKLNYDLGEKYKYLLKDVILLKSYLLLTTSFRTKKDLEIRLLQEFVHNIPEQEKRIRIMHKKIVEKVIEYLEKKRFLNDKEYAISYVLSHKNKNELSIKTYLKQKGIESSIINEILLEVRDEFYENNKNFIKKYMLNNEELCIENKEKIFSRLLNRGFKYDIIKKCYDEIINKKEV